MPDDEVWVVLDPIEGNVDSWHGHQGAKDLQSSQLCTGESSRGPKLKVRVRTMHSFKNSQNEFTNVWSFYISLSHVGFICRRDSWHPWHVEAGESEARVRQLKPRVNISSHTRIHMLQWCQVSISVSVWQTEPFQIQTKHNTDLFK